jgi:hypothetical protein
MREKKIAETGENSVKRRKNFGCLALVTDCRPRILLVVRYSWLLIVLCFQSHRINYDGLKGPKHGIFGSGVFEQIIPGLYFIFSSVKNLQALSASTLKALSGSVLIKNNFKTKQQQLLKRVKIEDSKNLSSPIELNIEAM